MELRLWTAAERVAYYRQRALEASDLAARSRLESTRVAFEELAAKWSELAAKVETGTDLNEDSHKQS